MSAFFLTIDLDTVDDNFNVTVLGTLLGISHIKHSNLVVMFMDSSTLLNSNSRPSNSTSSTELMRASIFFIKCVIIEVCLAGNFCFDVANDALAGCVVYLEPLVGCMI